jgi:protein-tyrosine phosphatase
MEQLYLEKKYNIILIKTAKALEKNPTNKAAIYYSALAKAQTGYPYNGLIKIIALIDPTNNMKQNHQLEEDRLIISKIIGNACTPDKIETIDHINMPSNFSWVWNGYLIGCSEIKKQQQLMILRSIGVTKVINLIEEVNRYELGLLYQDTNINLYHQTVKNGQPPTIEQMDNIMRSCEYEFRNNNQVVIHCKGGNGRAGTVIACLLLKHGFNEPTNYFLKYSPLSPTDVIKHLRLIRPGSIETNEQEIFIKQYYDHLYQEYKLQPSKISSFTQYPLTPYIYMSPLCDSDQIFNKQKLQYLISKKTQIIITEKLDGENCCLYKGKVYDRTDLIDDLSFNTIKDMYNRRILPIIEDHPELENLALYGENLTKIRSIRYVGQKDWFYLFGIFCEKRQMWYSWKDVEYVANILDLPVPPVVFSGEITSIEKLHDLLKKEISTPSMLSTDGKEGFVIRSADSFFAEDFGSMVCKYVK